nr:4Fe-4S binding protein [Paraclostridium bifermentans]
MEIEVYKKPNSIDCIRCGECVKSCPTNASSI